MELAIRTDDEFPRDRNLDLWLTGGYHGYNYNYRNLQELRRVLRTLPAGRTAQIKGSLETGYRIEHSLAKGVPYRNIGTINVGDEICPPGIKYMNLRMWIDEEHHEEIRDVLRDEYGLVPSRELDIPEKMRLVWTRGGEVYSVDFFGKNAPIFPLSDRETVLFRYSEDMITPEITELDPMLNTIQRIYTEFNSRRVETPTTIIDGRP